MQLSKGSMDYYKCYGLILLFQENAWGVCLALQSSNLAIITERQ
jgi:hypothetical protein